jgi:hypothetical protein
MSGQRMTSRDEADLLKAVIGECVNNLESMGFTRGTVGAAMSGIGIALVQVHDGHANALKVLNVSRDLLTADDAGRH